MAYQTITEEQQTEMLDLIDKARQILRTQTRQGREVTVVPNVEAQAIDTALGYAFHVVQTANTKEL